MMKKIQHIEEDKKILNKSHHLIRITINRPALRYIDKNDYNL